MCAREVEWERRDQDSRQPATDKEFQSVEAYDLASPRCCNQDCSLSRDMVAAAINN